jgi:ATP-dependent helicase/nuclease subunit A
VSVKFTDSQRDAIRELDQNISISAGAGSGKTEVLVSRFCRIVEQGLASVDEILTVTFTEKAAKEMKQRIVRRFDEKYEETGDRQFEDARRGVESAYIGTIHSFASRILRENAFAAGVDPKFTLLTDAEAKTLSDKVLDALFARLSESESPEYRALVFTYGAGTVRSALKMIVGEAASLGIDVAEVPVVPSPEDARAHAERCLSLIDQLFEMLDAGSLEGALVKRLADFRPKYAAIKDGAEIALSWKDGEFDWDLFGRQQQLKSLFAGTVGKDTIKRDYVEPAKEAAGQFLEALIAPLAEANCSHLKALAVQFADDYALAKKRAGTLDFNDLLLIAKSLVANPEIADEYRERFKYVVMDEFQDTNELQKGIVERVCRPDRLFTVGDVKQSIFGFVHSDVEVFIRHHRAIQGGRGSAVSFVENFRSRPGIINFVNWLFARIWGEDADFEFEHLEARGTFHERSGADVELLLIPKAGDTPSARYAEAQAIAARINELLGRSGTAPLKVTKQKEQGDPARDLGPGDIMVLFRTTSDIPLYERVLSEAGIECYVVSGRGFYEAHEVQDILNMLRVVENPLDDVAMAAVLRSPLVGVTDDTLWWLTRDYPEPDPEVEADETDIPARNKAIGKLYSSLTGLERVSEVDRSDLTKLEEFRETLRALHELRGESRVTRVIDEAISRTHYDLKILAADGGRRKFANVGKLIEVAQGFEASRLFALSDFVSYVENLGEVSAREAEAPTETEDSPVVRLMTVHKSKGLQAPVVIVADCTRKLSEGQSGAFLFSREGMASKVRNPLDDSWLLPEAYGRVADELKVKDLRESKRLFYVAATRAEELLIISGTSDYKGGAAAKASYSDVKTWSGWVEKALGITAEPESPQTILQAGEVPVVLSKGSAPADLVPLKPETIFSLRREEILSGRKWDADRGCPNVARCFATGDGFDAPIALTVSQVLALKSCPRCYYLKSVLGIVEPDDDERDEPRPEVAYSAATLGSVVHEVLSAVDFTQEFAPQIDRLLEYREEDIRERARAACVRLAASPWLARISGASERLSEVPFTAKLDGCTLLGRIDLLIREGSRWSVIDYKTGSASEKEDYRTQIGFYALAVKKCLGVVPEEVALVSLGSGRDFVAAVDAAVLVEAEQALGEVLTHIRSASYPRREHDGCEFCGYSGVCREQG